MCGALLVLAIAPNSLTVCLLPDFPVRDARLRPSTKGYLMRHRIVDLYVQAGPLRMMSQV